MASTIHGNYITHLDVSLNVTEEQELKAQGFKIINDDLNKGALGKYIYIWYKKEDGAPPITRIQVTFNDDMAVGLRAAEYTKIDKDLNAGAAGDHIYLWYFRGGTEYDIPIVDIYVTTDAKDEGRKLKSGWERLACDLNRGNAGNYIHAWVKRERQTYICDVTATDSYKSDMKLFEDGYIRVDEDTNKGALGEYVFIWYRQTTDSRRALSDLQISTNDCQHQELQDQNYNKVVRCSKYVNLNEGTIGHEVYLWYKQEESKPIKAITILVNPAAVEWYMQAGVKVIQRDLNTGNLGKTEYLCFYQEREPPW
ncbi:uncharacterized protein LOC121882519 [Thunnus maccoyii]|uniref:uncharacterized protein LOC121882519 n=1 Tax=Thunnus maccoyii TaxID=8240 RepID=UPI001C4AE5EB|nr:uncharacterized protein LOC121882519 [Thunnus maccoyii]XP_042246770.1 uncharacterized protein LOC121882519 [Thunnus maccoyii]